MKIDKIKSFCWKIIPSLILLLLVNMNIEGNIKKFDELIESALVYSQEIKVDQIEGRIQNTDNRKISFCEFEKFQPDLEKVVLSRVTKIVSHDNMIFILDERQGTIFVFDRKANFLYSIGRPGQGPGDLENPIDFYISRKSNIYVLNKIVKRVDVFSLKGKFSSRIQLKVPKDISYSYPSKILVDQKENIYIAYNLSSHLIDLYNNEGEFQKKLLEREEKVIIPGINLGNSSQILFFPNDNFILHFNSFTGVFKKVSKTGKLEKIFSVFDPVQKKQSRNIIKSIKEKREKTNSNSLSIKVFHLWSGCCIDVNSNIIVFSLLKKKEEHQKMFIFSSEGDFLYQKWLPNIENSRIESISYYEDLFIFKNSLDEVFLSKKEEGKYEKE